MNEILYRNASIEDLDAICEFTDMWLGGKAVTLKLPGATHDYFVPRGRHIKFLTKYRVLIAGNEGNIVGWAVCQRDGALIHMLVAPAYRGKGIGSKMLQMLNPPTVRSKTDQSTGDPIEFYLSRGYQKTSDEKAGKNRNIDILTR